jgi:NAD(P)-dependent dehydrogenase (short-subunit alcohol dehydrogenase family)
VKLDRALEGKVAVVTGGGSGQGRATALRFSAAGAAVAVFDVHEEAARGVVAEIHRLGQRALAVHVDVSSRAAVKDAFTAVRASLGATHVLATPAGIWPDPTQLVDLTAEEIQRVFAVNVFGVFYCAQEAARDMLDGDSGGRILLWSSCGARLAAAKASVYDATKSAIEGMGRSLAAELGHHGITVNIISPGLIDTPMSIGTDLELYAPMIPVGRVGESADVADLALFLASEYASFINGATIDIDGGSTSTNGVFAAVHYLKGAKLLSRKERGPQSW